MNGSAKSKSGIGSPLRNDVAARSARTPGHRVARRQLAALAIVLGLGMLVVWSPPALALSQRGHVFSFSFASKGTGEGELGEPAGLAVSEVGASAGDVYVVDRANNRIEKFNAKGEFISAWGWGVTDGEKEYEVCKSGEHCRAGIPGTGKGAEKFHLGKGQLLSPTAIAVDNCTSDGAPCTRQMDPSVGDVYVIADQAKEHTYVYKFGPEGEYKERITGTAEAEEYERAVGVAVDANGEVWVEWSGAFSYFTKYTDEEKSKRVKVRNAEGKREDEREIESAVEPLRAGFALDSEDNLYVGYEPGDAFTEASDEDSRYWEEGRGEAGEEPCEQSRCLAAKLTSVEREESTGDRLAPGEALIEELDHENTSGIAADPGASTAPGNDVYLDDVTSVAALSPSGSLIQRFGDEDRGGTPILDRGSGIAVDAAGDVYVADAEAGDIDVFAPEAVGAPTFESVSAQDVSAEAAQLDAVIDPRGERSSYYFEYGATGSCADSPATWTRSAGGEIGGEGFGDEGFGEEGVSVRLGEGTSLTLLSGTSYDYRVSAENGRHEQAVSGERCFSTPPATGKFIADERGWELVSPARKNGVNVDPQMFFGGVIQAAANGKAITYIAPGPFAEPEGARSPEYTQILSTRGKTGAWSAKDITTPTDGGTGLEVQDLTEYKFFSSDLALALLQPFPRGGPLAEPPLAPASLPAEEGHQQKTIYLRDDAPLPPAASEAESYEKARRNGEAEQNPGYLPLVTDANIASPEEFGEAITVLGATPSLSDVIIESKVPLTSGSAPGGRNLYEWHAGTLQPVNVLPNTAPAEGAELGGGSEDLDHAVSDDGSRVVFSITSGSRGLYLRDMTRDETIRLDKAQGVAEPEVGELTFQTANAAGSRVFFTDTARLTPGSGASVNKPDLYEFEVTSGEGEPLAGTLSDLTEPDLVGSQTGESASVRGLALGASEDGSYVYFVANGVLSSAAAEAGAVAGHCESEVEGTPLPGATCNLYVEHYEGEPGHGRWEEPRFIASLSSEDERGWRGFHNIGAVNQGELAARVSPNGRYLAFMSANSLTSFDGHLYDNDASNPAANNAPAEEVYLYDYASSRLVCASCDPSGSRPVGVLDPPRDGEEGLNNLNGWLLVDEPGEWRGRWLAGSLPGWTSLGWEGERALYQPRYLSDSGRVFFNSPEDLVPEATDGKENVYEYEPEGVPQGAHRCTSASATFSARADGCIGLISSGTSSGESAFLDASETGGEGANGEDLQEGGGDVFFITAAKLLAQDSESNLALYDAHECTGESPCALEESHATKTCESNQSCRPGALQALESASPVTGSAGPSGNIVAQKKVLASRTSVKPTTRAQMLATALRQCRKLKRTAKRLACEKSARKRYGPVAKHTTHGKISLRRTRS
jgi:hypothetical protein